MKALKATIIRELNLLKQKIITNHERAGQVASGRTKASLRVIEDADGASLVGASHFGVLEHGRKPGKVPKGFYEIIRQWVLDKGINYTPIPYVRRPSARWQPKYTPQERGLRSLSGAIASKIKKKGTRQFRKGRRIDIYTEPIDRTMEDITKEIDATLTAEISRIL